MATRVTSDDQVDSVGVGSANPLVSSDLLGPRLVEAPHVQHDLKPLKNYVLASVITSKRPTGIGPGLVFSTLPLAFLASCSWFASCGDRI